MITDILKDKHSSEITKENGLFKPGNNLIGRKTKRNTLIDLNSKRRCDICLEFEKYSDTNLVECIICRARCHTKCYNIEKKEEIDVSHFECIRCKSSCIIKKDFFNIKYYIINYVLDA